MTSLPRLLVLIGSGEMAPQMSRVHRSVIRCLAGEHVGASGVRAAIVDTPYGFQANADSISVSAVDYFGRRLGMSATIAPFRRADGDLLERETALERIREADFVFSGPGSPSYALRQWSGSEIPTLFGDKLAHGGALVAASAAALTLGALTLPVYEIYKSGADPFWMPGLDVLSQIGLSVAVVPHWDNAEGSGHDTRFCFLGQRRLEVLEEQLPEDVSILGIDEHTALVVDLDERRATIRGRGSVSVRQRGKSVVFGTGEEVSLDALGATASPVTTTPVGPTPGRPHQRGEDETARLARRVVVAEQNAAALAERAGLVEPLVTILLDVRQTARANGDYATADAIRGRLLALGVEVTDSADGSTSLRVIRTA